MMPMLFELPFPPSINGYWRCVGGQNRLSKKGREFRSSAVLALKCSKYMPKAPVEGRLSVTIYLHCPTKRKYDIDNFAKAILDSLTYAGVWEDDEQVDRLLINRGVVKKGGQASIIVARADWS